MADEPKNCHYHGAYRSHEHPVTHIVRHLCLDEQETNCKWMEIVYCCQYCHDSIVKAQSQGQKYHWDCEVCGSQAERKIVGKA